MNTKIAMESVDNALQGIDFRNAENGEENSIFEFRKKIEREIKGAENPYSLLRFSDVLKLVLKAAKSKTRT